MKSKTFSIIKFDLDKLDKKLNEYENETGDDSPYIFMNEQTINGVLFELDPLRLFRQCLRKNTDETIGEYKGCKMYVNNDLRFGEIELK